MISRAQSGGFSNSADHAAASYIIPWPAEIAPTLNAHFGNKMGLENQHINGGAGLFVGAAQSAVRRLTPRECERLQGFPDDYTLTPHRNKLMADGPRYKALGNSMAVPVMHWIGKRIQMVEDLKEGNI
jgi:DNA (cytosine-5)-methyltransferase 1